MHVALLSWCAKQNRREVGVASMTSAGDEEWIFGRCVLRLQQRTLLTDGVPQEIGSRAFDVLLALAQSGGDLVSKEALFEAAWPGVVVGEDNLYAQIAALRRVLGPDRESIVTAPGRGHRFTAPVLRRSAAAAPSHARGAPAAIVLPFLDLYRYPGAEPLADAVTEALTVALARTLSGVQMISCTTAFAYRGRAVTARQVCDDLGVRYVLEGSVAFRDGRIRANAQLIDAASDAHLWAERFERPCGDDLLAKAPAPSPRSTPTWPRGRSLNRSGAPRSYNRARLKGPEGSGKSA